VMNTAEVIEIKTTAGYCTRPERHWLHQVQAQLLCTGIKRAHLVVLDSSLSSRPLTSRRIRSMADVSAKRPPPSWRQSVGGKCLRCR
jgi:hypothetical protein